MSGLEARTDGLTQGSVYQHHLVGAGEFSTGEMGNFQPALTHSDNAERRPGRARLRRDPSGKRRSLNVFGQVAADWRALKWPNAGNGDVESGPIGNDKPVSRRG